SWRSLLRLVCGRRFIARWPAVATVVAALAAVATISAVTTVAEAAAVAVAEAAAVVPVTIAINLAHHHRRPFLVLVDAHREIAQHVLVEPLLALDLVHHRWRRIEIHKRVVRLAVLAQAIGKRLDAPLLELRDLAPQLFDDAFELGGQLFDLLRTHILARQEHVFVKRHAMPFPCSVHARTRRVALRALSGKARKLRRREHGTPGHQALPPASPAAVRSA